MKTTTKKEILKKCTGKGGPVVTQQYIPQPALGKYKGNPITPEDQKIKSSYSNPKKTAIEAGTFVNKPLPELGPKLQSQRPQSIKPIVNINPMKYGKIPNPSVSQTRSLTPPIEVPIEQTGGWGTWIKNNPNGNIEQYKNLINLPKEDSNAIHGGTGESYEKKTKVQPPIKPNFNFTAQQKQILKKYTGQGGIIKDTVKEIPGTLKEMGKNIAKGNLRKGLDPGDILGKVGKGIKKGIGWVGGQIEKDLKYQDSIYDEHKEWAENEYGPLKDKKKILKNSIKTMPLPKTPKSIPLNTPKRMPAKNY